MNLAALKLFMQKCCSCIKPFSGFREFHSNFPNKLKLQQSRFPSPHTFHSPTYGLEAAPESLTENNQKMLFLAALIRLSHIYK